MEWIKEGPGKSNLYKTEHNWQIEANFTINLHTRDLYLLKLIQAYFEGAGRIGK